MSIDIDIQPKAGSATERRQVRMTIRHVLGISRDMPPNFQRLISAVTHMDRLLDLTTGGAYRIRVFRDSDAALMSPERLRDEYYAQVRARRAAQHC